MHDSSTPRTFVAPEPAELAPHFHGHEIHDLIATGGMGAVYRASHKFLGRQEAIKILPREFGDDPEFRSGFEAEARAMAKLNHPNLIAVYDFGEVDGMLFIVMEFVPGKSLFHSAKGKAIDPKEVIRLVTGICSGLAHAHENGILHRDIKPSNILLTPQAEPKIGDFGLARPVERKTQQGEVIYGTPGYTAPEVLNAPDSVDCRTDLFSVGVLLHELLTGKLPADDPRPASEIADCSIRFDTIIRRATDPLPANRYYSAKEIAVELRVIGNLPKGDSVAKAPLVVVASPKLIVPRAPTSRPAPLLLAKPKKKRFAWGKAIMVVLLIIGYWHYFTNVRPGRENRNQPTQRQPKPEVTYETLDETSPNDSKSGRSTTQEFVPLPTPGGSSSDFDDLTPQERIHKKFNGVYLNFNTWYLFHADGYGNVIGFQTDLGKGTSLIKGKIEGQKFLSKWIQNVTNSPHEFTYQLLPDSNISLVGKHYGNNGKRYNYHSTMKRVSDPNECLRIIDKTAASVTDKDAKTALAQLKSIYVDPIKSTDRNTIGSKEPTNSKSVCNATDLELLIQKIGQIIVVRGQVKNLRRYSSGKPLILEFSDPAEESLSVLMPVSDAPTQFTESNLRQYVGKTIEVSGVLEMINQRLVIKIRSLDELEIVGDGSGVSEKSIDKDQANERRGTPPGVPTDATYFNGKWYRVFEEKISWTDARDKCKKLGGQLVVIRDEAAQIFVRNLNGGRIVWLGGSDSDQEGLWRWIDGTRLHFSRFYPGQPRGGTRENYLAMSGQDGGLWHDYPHSDSAIVGYICEWPDKSVAITSSASPKMAPAPPRLTSPTAGTIVSDFEEGTEGWVGINTANGIENVVFQNGGADSTPKGSISLSETQGDNQYSYFSAPSEYLGDKRSAHKGILRFKLKQSATSATSDSYPFVVLKSRRYEIRYPLFQVPSANTWTEFEIPIDENKGWITSTYDHVKRALMLQVLGSLESIWILAEFSGNASDRVDLDDVWLVPGSEIRRIQRRGAELPDIVGTWRYSESVQLEIRPEGTVLTNSKPNGKWTQRDKLTEFSIVLADRSTFIATLDESKSNLRIADRANGRGRSIERIHDGPTQNPDVPDQIAIWRMECLKIEATIISREASIRSSSQYKSMYEKELISLRGRYQELRSKINSK